MKYIKIGSYLILLMILFICVKTVFEIRQITENNNIMGQYIIQQNNAIIKHQILIMQEVKKRGFI